MFPTRADPRRGIFVEKIGSILKAAGCQVTNCVQYRPGITAGFLLQIKALVLLMVLRVQVVYVHFPARCGLIALMARALGKEVVLNFHGSDVWMNSNRLAYGYYLNLIAISVAHRVICPSQWMVNRLVTAFPCAEKTEVHVLPSGGVASCYFQRAASIKACASILGLPIKIGFVDSIYEGKRASLILDLLEMAPRHSYRFIIAGCDISQGDKWSDYHDNPLVEFTGVLDQHGMASFYSNLDILLFPSSPDESLGLVVLEAMASGVIVLSADIPSLTEIIEDGISGFKCSGTSAAEYLSVLEKIRVTEKPRISAVRSAATSVAYAFREDALGPAYLEALNLSDQY